VYAAPWTCLGNGDRRWLAWRKSSCTDQICVTPAAIVDMVLCAPYRRMKKWGYALTAHHICPFSSWKSTLVNVVFRLLYPGNNTWWPLNCRLGARQTQCSHCKRQWGPCRTCLPSDVQPSHDIIAGITLDHLWSVCGSEWIPIDTSSPQRKRNGNEREGKHSHC
jgi:hypothetical protein